MKLKYCPICGKEGIYQNLTYEDEYECFECSMSFEILLINETGKEKIN